MCALCVRRMISVWLCRVRAIWAARYTLSVGLPRVRSLGLRLCERCALERPVLLERVPTPMSGTDDGGKGTDNGGGGHVAWLCGDSIDDGAESTDQSGYGADIGMGTLTLAERRAPIIAVRVLILLKGTDG